MGFDPSTFAGVAEATGSVVVGSTATREELGEFFKDGGSDLRYKLFYAPTDLAAENVPARQDTGRLTGHLTRPLRWVQRLPIRFGLTFVITSDSSAMSA